MRNYRNKNCDIRLEFTKLRQQYRTYKTQRRLDTTVRACQADGEHSITCKVQTTLVSGTIRTNGHELKIWQIYETITVLWDVNVLKRKVKTQGHIITLYPYVIWICKSNTKWRLNFIYGMLVVQSKSDSRSLVHLGGHQATIPSHKFWRLNDCLKIC